MLNDSGSAAVRLVFGLLIITVGILFFLGNMGIINPYTFLRLWPTLLIVAGMIHILQPHRKARFSLGIILVVVGSVMLLNRLFIIDLSLHDFWPLILIFVGIMIVLNHSVFHRTSHPFSQKIEDDNSFLKESSILGGSHYKCDSQDFKGGDLTAIMGGFEIDLRNASIEKEATLDVLAVMGGVEMRVPDDWIVILKGTPILGGFDDKTHAQKDAVKRLIVRGTAIMGGVEIKN